VLNLYRVGAETELHTDASKQGYGTILLQRSVDDGTMHPIHYASGKTTPAEEKYTSYELEVLAIVKALRKFRVYLIGIAFKIVTDCRAFALTMSKKDLCVRVARWALLLEEFNYNIEHRPGKSMTHVDALSRNPLPTCLLIDESDDDITARLRKAQNDDEEIREIVRQIENQKNSDYVIRGGLLFKEINGDYRLVVPKTMHTQIIRRAHEREHFAATRTEAIIKRDYYIRNLRSKVEKVVRNCIDCILAEKKQGKQEGFSSTIDKGKVPLDTYHIDHLGPLASTRKNYKHIFVVIDSFSKFTWLYAVKSTNSAEVIDRFKKQAAVFGNPRRIISDRGTAFTSGDFREYCKYENIQHVLTTTGIPRANGQVERVNRTLIPLLTKMTAPRPEEWYKHLNVTQLYLNTTMHRSIATAPFHLLFGTHARLRNDDNIRQLLENEWVTSFQKERNELRVRAKENIAKIQRENHRTFNKRRKEPRIYREGDLVGIKRTQQVPGLKLASKYLGPYQVTKVLRHNRYLVHKVGIHEGPQEQTSTAADYMKLWPSEDSEVESDGNEPDERKEEKSRSEY
jgi:transposase InsO family protein